MADDKALATKRFMKSLFDDKVTRSLEKVAKLPERERRAALASPAPYLKKAGLELPRDITVTAQEEPLNRESVPRHLLPQIGQMQRPVLVCFRFCEWIITPGGVRQRCVWVCFIGELIGADRTLRL